jgi:hypothetical protein
METTEERAEYERLFANRDPLIMAGLSLKEREQFLEHGRKMHYTGLSPMEIALLFVRVRNTTTINHKPSELEQSLIRGMVSAAPTIRRAVEDIKASFQTRKR